MNIGGIGGTPPMAILTFKVRPAEAADPLDQPGMGGASAVGGSIGSGTTGVDGIFPGGGAAGAGLSVGWRHAVQRRSRALLASAS